MTKTKQGIFLVKQSLIIPQNGMPLFSNLYKPHPLDRDNRFDLLRLLAALLVFFSQCFPLCAQNSSEPFAFVQYSLGAVAVDIFFVISGFLITQSFAQKNLLLKHF